MIKRIFIDAFFRDDLHPGSVFLDLDGAVSGMSIAGWLAGCCRLMTLLGGGCGVAGLTVAVRNCCCAHRGESLPSSTTHPRKTPTTGTTRDMADPRPETCAQRGIDNVTTKVCLLACAMSGGNASEIA